MRLSWHFFQSSKGVRILVIVACCVAVLGSILLSHREVHSYSLATIEVADTREKQIQGLSGRMNVPDDYGMLFVFPEATIQRFWMKDMLVPIDILWIGDDGSLVGAVDNVATSTYPEVFASPVPVKYVLEVQAGLRIQRGWDKGTKLSLPLK